MPDPAPSLKRELRLVDLVFLNIAAVASVRWVASAAHAGPGSITLWIIAIAAFFVPSALVVVSLARRFPEEGGLYIWSRNAFGPWHGFLCAWFYFLSNVLFIPGLALAAVSMSAYIWNYDPAQLAQNRTYTLTLTLILMWSAFLAHLFGLRIAKWAGNVGGAATYLSAAALAGVAGWIAWRHGSVTHFDLVPAPTFDSLNLWSQIAFALIGLEMGAILGGEIVNPRRNIPRAAWIAAIGCALFYIAGTAAILVVLPARDVSASTGLAQAAHSAGILLGMPAFSPLFALLIVIGLSGSLATWIAGNTRLPFVIGLDRHLPAAFGQLHQRWATPHVSILSQAVAGTLLLAATQAGETVAAAYQILLDMTIFTAFIPFLYIFGAAWKYGQRVAAAFGMAISVAALALSVIPPPDVVSWPVFEAKVLGGSVLLGGLGWLIFSRNREAASA